MSFSWLCACVKCVLCMRCLSLCVCTGTAGPSSAREITMCCRKRKERSYAEEVMSLFSLFVCADADELRIAAENDNVLLHPLRRGQILPSSEWLRGRCFNLLFQFD